MTETPTKKRRVTYADAEDIHEFVTPTKRTPARRAKDVNIDAPSPVVNADRSARRKSARRLIERNALPTVEDSDDDELAEEDKLARRILNDNEDEDDSEEEVPEDDETAVEPETPSKKGRPKQRKKLKERTPTPPRDLPPHEQYFYDNRPGGNKTSNSTLASLNLPTHDTFFEQIKAYQDPHQPEIDFLHSLHSRSFEQWKFELDHGFNLCLYGWGSKRSLLLDFAEHLSNEQAGEQIVVVNGYNPSLTLRDVLHTIASLIPGLANPSLKLGAQPAEMLQTILKALQRTTLVQPVKLLIHCMDAAAIRRPQFQSTLARLAASKSIGIIASADTRTFPIMWDATLSTQFNWLFHDVTTFKPFDLEISGGSGVAGVVDDVNALFGRTGRKLQGREGVMYVLRSLTENARNLYALLIAELLSMDDMDDVGGSGEEDFEQDGLIGKRGQATASTRVGIDFRTLYQKAASQFIATNEPTFRALLREFYDHEMLASRKDALGGETFAVPFRKEEMQTILEELMT